MMHGLINYNQSVKILRDRNAAVVNAVIQTLMNFDIGTKWKITHSMSVFGARSPLELSEKISKYSFA